MIEQIINQAGKQLKIMISCQATKYTSYPLDEYLRNMTYGYIEWKNGMYQVEDLIKEQTWEELCKNK